MRREKVADVSIVQRRVLVDVARAVLRQVRAAIDPADRVLRVVPDVRGELGKRVRSDPPRRAREDEDDDPSRGGGELREPDRRRHARRQPQRRRRLQEVLRQIAAAVDRDRDARDADPQDRDPSRNQPALEEGANADEEHVDTARPADEPERIDLRMPNRPDEEVADHVPSAGVGFA